ncbi:hypothetical protein F5Y03DRAFT_394975 [Xylaria venustula]|nr:hypothetical protein F5Y03DRAFT_394975 [Xylaria venustula]
MAIIGLVALFTRVVPILAAPSPSRNLLISRQAITCYYSITASGSGTCNSVAAAWGLTDTEFEALNPAANCPTLAIRQSHCISQLMSLIGHILLSISARTINPECNRYYDRSALLPPPLPPPLPQVLGTDQSYYY